MATNILNSTGYISKKFISPEYKINILARMLAGYDEETWNKLKRNRKLTYIRAASNLYHRWAEIHWQMVEWIAFDAEHP